MAVLSFLGQAILVTLGYGMALLAAALFASIAIMNVGMAGFVGDWEQLLQTVLLFASTSLGAFPQTVAPAALFVVLSELTRLRGFVVHLVAGCVIGLVAALPVGTLMEGEVLPDLPGDVVRLAVASGAVGGFVYWLIAGRRAGRWLDTAA
ncbi:MAG: hypothetical protein AAF318_12790 [Pseudomonadota bacterium]